MKKVLSIILSVLLISAITANTFAIGIKVDTGEAGVVEETTKEITTTKEPVREKETYPVIQQPDDSYFAEPVTLPETEYQYTEEATTKSNYVRRLYNVSFRAYVEDGVSDYIDITVHNLNTNKSYSFRLFETNQYFKVAELPAGEYSLTSGTVAGDTLNKYPVETIYFIIGKQLNTFVPFNVGKPKEPYSHNIEDFSTKGYKLPEYETMSNSDTDNKGTVTEPVTNENDNNSHKSGLFSKIFPAFVIIIIIIVYIFRKKQNSEPLNSDTSDYRL